MIVREKLLAPLQLASGLLLLVGWWTARSSHVSASTGMAVLLTLWLAGSIAAAVACKVSAQRRFLSVTLIALNILGLFLAAIALWDSHQEIH
jgi:hypothetical protein